MKHFDNNLSFVNKLFIESLRYCSICQKIRQFILYLIKNTQAQKTKQQQSHTHPHTGIYTDKVTGIDQLVYMRMYTELYYYRGIPFMICHCKFVPFSKLLLILNTWIYIPKILRIKTRHQVRLHVFLDGHYSITIL